MTATFKSFDTSKKSQNYLVSIVASSQKLGDVFCFLPDIFKSNVSLSMKKRATLIIKPIYP